MTPEDEFEAKAILEVLQGVHDIVDADPHEGLRERKKRLLRQRISNTATALFLAHGFENVTVAQIAATCDVSEQTVFNYFPTKESMFFDRSESAAEALASAMRERDGRALIEAVVEVLLDDAPLDDWPGMDEAQALRLFRLFWHTAETSPTLRAAQRGDIVHLTAVMAEALAERVGADPEDPEVQITAFVVLGLAQTRVRSSTRRVHEVTTIAALRAAVRADVHRAARIVAPTLDAFDAFVPGDHAPT